VTRRSGWRARSSSRAGKAAASTGYVPVGRRPAA
jgi:hypothetical protein